jgi:hypothetical protein
LDLLQLAAAAVAQFGTGPAPTPNAAWSPLCRIQEYAASSFAELGSALKTAPNPPVLFGAHAALSGLVHRLSGSRGISSSGRMKSPFLVMGWFSPTPCLSEPIIIH